jgi:hypothetical protein
MAITVVAVIENMCLSRRQKAEHVTYRTHAQTSASFMLLVAQKPDQAPICPVCQESDQHYNLTSKIRTDQTVCQNRPYE